jgi:RNA polymerase sigma factor (sigma-70 family)
MRTPTMLNDPIDIVVKAQSGDIDAYTKLVLHYQNLAYGYAFAKLHDFHLARDATQETFLAVYYGLGRLKEPKAFPSWLKTIINNQCQRILRKRRGSVINFEEGYHDQLLESTYPSQQIEVEEDDNKILALSALQMLSRDDREVVTLFYLKSCSQKEIATFLGIPVSTVNSRLNKARIKLSKLIRRKTPLMIKNTFRKNTLSKEFAYGVGEILKVQGPILEIQFNQDDTPNLFDMVTVAESGGEKINAKVIQRLSNGSVRCLMGMKDTGPKRAAKVINTCKTDLGTISEETINNLIRLTGSPNTEKSKLLETGIKILDLFSPFREGGKVGIFSGAGVGRGVLHMELVHRLARKSEGLTLFHLVGPTERDIVRSFRDEPEYPGEDVGSIKAFYLLTMNATDPNFSLNQKNFDASIFCSRIVACEQLWPAIDPLFSNSNILKTSIVGVEHCEIVQRMQKNLREVKSLMADSLFLEYLAIGANHLAVDRLKEVYQNRLKTLSPAEKKLISRTRKLKRFLSQPFFVAEKFTKTPGKYVPLKQTLIGCKQIMDGEYDNLPEEAFEYIGPVEDAIEKAKNLDKK